MHALLRRLSEPPKSCIAFPGLVIDVNGRSVTVDNIALELSLKEFELLIYLVHHAGTALNREQILNAVWNYDFVGNTRTVDTHIKKLRQKLGARGYYIKTLRGLGYKFEVK